MVFNILWTSTKLSTGVWISLWITFEPVDKSVDKSVDNLWITLKLSTLYAVPVDKMWITYIYKKIQTRERPSMMDG